MFVIELNKKRTPCGRLDKLNTFYQKKTSEISIMHNDPGVKPEPKNCQSVKNGVGSPIS